MAFGFYKKKKKKSEFLLKKLIRISQLKGNDLPTVQFIERCFPIRLLCGSAKLTRHHSVNRSSNPDRAG